MLTFVGKESCRLHLVYGYESRLLYTARSSKPGWAGFCTRPVQGIGIDKLLVLPIADLSTMAPDRGVDSVNLFELENDDRLKWAVKKHAVIVTWREETDQGKHTLWHLGDRTPHNQEPSQLYIWIGEDVVNSRLLIVLSIRIRLRSSSKAVPRQMFLVIPSESLHIESTTPTYEQISRHDVPHMLVDQPSDKSTADLARILHISFSLGSDTSNKVIMPKAESQRPTVGQPLLLLENLRSLSKARKFNVYLNFNTYAQQHLNTLSPRLEKGNLMTPSIDLTSMYAGRGGAINNWSAQGLLEDDQNVSSMFKRRKLVRDGDAQVIAPDQPPPPYSNRGGQTCVPRSCTPVSFHLSNDSGSCVPETPLMPQGEGVRHSCTIPDHLVDAALHDNDTLPGNIPLAASGSTPFDAPLPIEPDSPACAPLQADALFPARALLSVNDPVPAANVVLPVSESPQAIAPRFNSASSTNFPIATDSCQADPLSKRVRTDMCWWLIKAWTTCPDAHFLFIANLLCIGAAAQANDNILYDKHRAACTTELLYYNAKNKDRSYPTTGIDVLCRTGRRATAAFREKAVKQETARSILWMNIINPNADILLIKDCLARWAEQGFRLIEFGEDGNGSLDAYATLLKDFNRLKALCVMEACLYFGKEAMASAEEIMVKMRQEVA